MRSPGASHAWYVFNFFLLTFLLFPEPTLSQGTASVAPADLNYLVDNAHTIVRGHVVSAVLQPHPQFENLQTVLVTFAVAKTLKGQANSTVTFRQFVWDLRDATKSGGYHKSEELLLFLNPTSTYGLTSPVGMDQGRFRVIRDNRGNGVAINGRANVGLFFNVVPKATSRGVAFSPQAKAMLSSTGGQVSLEILEEAIQALVAKVP